jgi:hypothetical protein
MHVYALCHSTATIALPDGVASSLERVTQARITAIVEPDLQLEALQQDDDRLLHAVLVHDRVIRELFQQTTVIPLRFTAFPTEPELIADLETQQQTYLETLARLDGKAEFVLKFVPKSIVEQPLDPEIKGKNYFLAKKRQHQEQQQQRELQSQELNQIMQAIAQQFTLSTAAEAYQFYVLASQENIHQCQEKISYLITDLTQWDCAMGEILPPYHFV